MTTVTLEEAQAHLPELIARLHSGVELVITRDQKPVARLTGAVEPSKPERKLGTMQGTVLSISYDFDAPLDILRSMESRA